MKVRLFAALLVIIFLMRPVGVQACTLWAAAGDDCVKGGGTLIVKNRDWRPDHRQELRVIKPDSGYSYVGLYAVGNDSPGLKGGVNEHGLVVVSATAGSIPQKERAAMKSARNVSGTLLTRCDGVDAALKRTDLFLGPQILMLSDRKKVAYVEIGPEGKFAAKATETGVLRHTNHYMDEKLLWANKSIGVSSQTRYDRIGQLLTETPRPFALKAFIGFSQDQSAGPDNSIWRTGSSPDVSRTMAVWIVAVPPTGSPSLYLKLANPNEAQRVIEAKISDLLSGAAKVE